MKRFYQKEWHGIPFLEFIDKYSDKLADEQFYRSYYKSFFNRYESYSDLDPAWLEEKKNVAKWLVETLPEGSTICSIGCGVGYIEQYLWINHSSQYEIFVQDFAPEACQWLDEIIPSENIFNLDIVQLNMEKKFDLIYLSAIAYAMSDNDLIEFLCSIKKLLSPRGKVVLVSSGYYEKPVFPASLINIFKDCIKQILSYCLLYERGQFWGWLRTSKEFELIMQQAGYTSISTGYIKTVKKPSIAYYIQGKGI